MAAMSNLSEVSELSPSIESGDSSDWDTNPIYQEKTVLDCSDFESNG